MKKVKVLLSMLFLTQISVAQDIDICRRVVDLSIEAINNQSSTNLNNHLSDDFTMAGQKGETAKLVLAQLLSQLGENVKSHEEVNQNKLNEGLELKYRIEYEKMGIKEATFIFDKNNMIKGLNLFKIEVKTLNDKSEIKKPNKDIIEVPFYMAGNLIAVNVLLNGEKRTFILDNGSPKVILNSKYFSGKERSQRTISSSKGVSGNISGMDIENVEQLDFGGIQLINQEVITLDLSHLEEKLDTDIYGLIGFDLIKDYDIIFNYKTLKLTFINPDIFEKYRDENLLHNNLSSVPFMLEGHIPVVEAQINNKTLAFGIDCGAESNLIDDHLIQSLKGQVKRIKTDRLVGAENNPKEIKIGKIKNTLVGKKEFKNLPTAFSDISHLNEAYGLKLDGLIGYQVLSKQRTLLSFARKEMIFIE
ncbi:MAG: pepsin/retropepsin-like aspartic protease family protein [Bacteroidia bacterium]